MITKVIAKTVKGKEYIYSTKSAHKVSANSAEKILTVLNNVRWNLKNDDEIWHIYDVDEYDTAYDYAIYQKFTIRKGIVKAVYGY